MIEFDKIADSQILDFDIINSNAGTQDLYLVADFEKIRTKAFSGELIGKLASKASGTTNFLDSEESL